MGSKRLRAAFVIASSAAIGVSGPALAQLVVPTPPPVQPVNPTVPSPVIVVPTSVPSLEPTIVPTALPTLPVPTALPTALPTTLPVPTALPTTLPTIPVPTVVPTAAATGLPLPLPVELPTVLPTLPVPLPSLPMTLPGSLPGLPVGVPLPALPGLDGTTGLAAGAVRVPTVAGVSEVYLDLNGDGLADARIATDGTVKRVSAQQAAAVDRSTHGAGTKAARALAAQARRPAVAAPTAVDRVRAASSSSRSPAVLLFASLLALGVAGSQVRVTARSR